MSVSVSKQVASRLFPDSQFQFYPQSIQMLERMAGERPTWSNFNSSDPGITLLEQLCLMLADVEYRISHNVCDLMSGFQPLRHDVCTIQGVCYCWFKPSPEAGRKREGFTRLTHQLYLLLDPGVTDESERSNITLRAKSLISGFDFMDAETVHVIAACPLLPVREQGLSSSPQYTAREVFCGYPVNHADFRRLIMDLIGVNNAWLVKVEPGIYDIVYELSDETSQADTAEIEQRIREKVQKYRPLGTEFGQLRSVEYTDLLVDLSIDLGPDYERDLKVLGAEIIDFLSHQVKPVVVYSGLSEFSDEDRQLQLNGPMLSSGYLGHSYLSTTMPKCCIKASDLRMALNQHFHGRIDFVRKLKLNEKGGEGNGIDVTVDVSARCAKLQGFELKLFSQGELLQSFSGELANTNHPHRKEAFIRDGMDISGNFNLQTPSGCDRSLSSYQAVYHYLPEVYQAKIQLDDSVSSTTQKVDAAQLRAYLGFFDFVLSNVLRTLEHFVEPFSLFQYGPYTLEQTSTSQLTQISDCDYFEDKNAAKSESEQETYQRLLAAHEIIDRQLSNMGMPAGAIATGCAPKRAEEEPWPIANEKLLRLYQIKRDLIGLLFQSEGFLNTVGKLQTSVNHSYQRLRKGRSICIENKALDHLIKKLSLQIEALYIQNGLAYSEEDCLFHLVDHIDQFNHLPQSQELSLEYKNGLTCLLPADPGAVYLTGLCFEGAGQAYAQSFQWPPKKVSRGEGLTLEMMVLVPDKKTGIQTLFSIGNKGGNNRFQVHLVDTDGWMHFDYGPGGNRVSVDYNGYFNRWVHLAVSVEPGEQGMLTIHLDGKQVEQEPFYDIPTDVLKGFHLGHRQADEDTCYSFWGRVADVRFWSKPRTTKELNDGRGKVFDPGTETLELYWPLGKGNCMDFSGNNHTLMLTPEVRFCDDEPSRVDFDEDEEDEYTSVYQQISRRLLHELPAHLPLNIYCLSDRLYQWLGRSFSSPCNVVEGRQQALQHYLMFFEKHCLYKDIITADRIGHLVIFDKIMQWVKSFLGDESVSVELLVEPDYGKAAKFAIVRVGFKQHLAAWYTRYQALQSKRLSPLSPSSAQIDFDVSQIESINNDVIWQTWCEYLKADDARKGMNEVLEGSATPLDSSMAEDQAVKIRELEYRLVMNHRIDDAVP